MKILPKMLFCLAVTVFIYGTCNSVNCAIINSPPNHHANNIISKDAINNTVLEIPIDDHSEIIAIRRNESEENKRKTSKPTKMFQHKKVLTTIMHPLPKTMHDLMPHEAAHHSHVDHKKFHDDFMKHEVPKLQKKLHHHYTVEEMRQRRKELKEKWQAKHDKHEQHEENKKYSRKHHGNHMEHTVNKTQKWRKPEKTVADMYDQATPQSAGLLQHKTTTKDLDNIDSSPQSLSMNSERKTPHDFSGAKGAKRSVETAQKSQLEWHEKKEEGRNPSAEANIDFKQKIAVIGGVPVLDALDFRKGHFMAEMHEAELTRKRNQTNKPEEKSEQHEERELFQRAVVQKTTTESLSPALDDVVSVKIDTSNEIPAVKEVRIPIQRPVFSIGKSAEQLGGIQLDDERSERVAGIDVHPGLEFEQVTIKIDTPPYYRNLTHEEKILIQRPLWGAGKSAEEVDARR